MGSLKISESVDLEEISILKTNGRWVKIQYQNQSVWLQRGLIELHRRGDLFSGRISQALYEAKFGNNEIIFK